MGRYVIIVFGIVVLLVGCGGAPSSEDVVTAFEDEGLEVGDSYPVEEDEVWQAFEHPENYEDGTRFEIPSLGVGAGGRVFTFDSEDDLNEMRALYEDMAETPGVSSHLYQEDLVLLQVNGELPKAQADAYGDVLSQEV